MNSLSTLGVVHTLISLVAIPSAVTAIVQSGRIDPRTRAGKLYVVSALLGALTAIGVIKTPVGAGIVAMTLLMLLVGVLAARVSWFGRFRDHVEIISLSVSFFFVLVPGVTETLTRLPVGAPIAPSLTSPILLGAQLSLVIALLVGVALQISRRRAVPQPA
jgi:hypothetical protein